MVNEPDRMHVSGRWFDDGGRVLRCTEHSEPACPICIAREAGETLSQSVSQLDLRPISGDRVREATDRLMEHYELFRNPRYGTPLVRGEYEDIVRLVLDVSADQPNTGDLSHEEMNRRLVESQRAKRVSCPHGLTPWRCGLCKDRQLDRSAVSGDEAGDG
jgi:hypothetical protein